MDILSHGLWGIVYSKAVNRKLPSAVPMGWAFFWGMFPDLFAFSIPFAIRLMAVIFGNAKLSEFGPPQEGELKHGPLLLASRLYNISHSLVVFVIVFALVSFILKKPPLIIIPWVLHILFDIPTHTAEFFPTPVFWPLSDWKFLGGFSWATPWFMILNYGAIMALLILL